MDGLKHFLTALAVVMLIAGCSTHTVDDPVEGQSAADDFAEFDQQSTGGSDIGIEDEAAVENEIAANDTGGSTQDEFSEFDAAPSGGDAPAIDPSFDANQMAQNPSSDELPPPQEIPPADIPSSDPMAQQDFPPAEEPAMGEPTGQIVNITALQFRANDNGGTVVVEGDGPMHFDTRLNPDTNQFVIEIPSSKLPTKLTRPLNTRDFGGNVGAVNAYQNANSGTTRIVVQLRPGAPEPVVQAEGNSLLVVTTPAPSSDPMAQAGGGEMVAEESVEVETPNSKLMSSDNLEDFIANNQTFYGKKLSIETDEVDVREIFKIISDEANVNLILADDVTGKVSVKLKNVPWDQALVLLMKAKKLGYTRSGNVLRIASLQEIQKEEKDAFDLQSQRRQNAPPKVRTVQVNYAKVEDLERQLKGILSKTGTVVADARTSALIITDFDENIERAIKVVQSLDVPPQQVLIEGKIVEAQENSEESMGIRWGLNGGNATLGGGANALRLGTNMNVTPGIGQQSFNFGLNLGTFDLLGDLSATLALFEQEGKVKVLSSPRIVTMHNEKAVIEQTLQIPIRQTQQSAGPTITSISFKDVKLSLDVTPQVTNDGAVTMKIDMLREFPGSVADAVDGARPINSRKASTRVLVRNGQTAVIGGIYQNDMTQGETRVPGLGKLPVIGWLFRQTSQSDTRNELLMFLTPRIVGQLDSQVIPSQTGGDGGLDF